MAVHRVWFYKGLPGIQSRPASISQPILEEPYLSTETVDTGSGAAATGAAPGGTDAIVVRPTAAVYYLVNNPGSTTAASNVNRRLAADSDTILHVKPGGNVSFLEV